MKSLTAFGTYGFLSAIIAAQMAASSLLAAKGLPDEVDRAGVDTKKAARSVKREVKKDVRKATGRGSVWEDAKDKASDTLSNIKDETNYQKRKIERKDPE